MIQSTDRGMPSLTEPLNDCQTTAVIWRCEVVPVDHNNYNKQINTPRVKI